MRILITGAGGMLARALVPGLRSRGHEVIAFDRKVLDVTDELAVRRGIASMQPDAVVQCAAYTAVDDAEKDESRAFLINATATRIVVEACQKVGARLVYPSTDYVFSGVGHRPYRPDDVPSPINAYGRSKLAGERAALQLPRTLIIRTSWLYGAGGTNFVDTMLRLARTQPRLAVVDDQIGRPTSTASLSECVAGLIESNASGIFHASDGGDPTNWFGFAKEIFDLRSLSIHIEPVATSEFPRPAPRPLYSVLDCSVTETILGRPMLDWRAGLRAYLCGNPHHDL